MPLLVVPARAWGAVVGLCLAGDAVAAGSLGARERGGVVGNGGMLGGLWGRIRSLHHGVVVLNVDVVLVRGVPGRLRC